MAFILVNNASADIHVDVAVITDDPNRVMSPGVHARYLIRQKEPDWVQGRARDQLAIIDFCRNALACAERMGCESLALPMLTGIHNRVAEQLVYTHMRKEILDFLEHHEMRVYLVVFDRKKFDERKAENRGLAEYIDEHYAEESYTGFEYREPARFPVADTVCRPFPATGRISKDPDELKSFMKHLDAGFSETLLKLIDRTGKTDAEVYRRANVDRKLFSKIRNNPDYRPSKTTALAFAFALQLDLDQTKDLIGRAGFALSHSSKMDVIVEYCIIHKNYNLFSVNEILFEYDQPLIGA